MRLQAGCNAMQAFVSPPSASTFVAPQIAEDTVFGHPTLRPKTPLGKVLKGYPSECCNPYML